MATVTPVPFAKQSRAGLAILVALLVAAMAWFIGHKIHYLTDFSLPSYTAYYWPRRLGLALHLAGGITAITTGVIQVWLGLTHRIGVLHRTLGKVYVASILVASTGGFYLAVNIDGPLSYRCGLAFLDLAWLVTTGMAIFSVRTGRIEQHREWMLRSYIVTFAFVTFRLVEDLLRPWISVPETLAADDLDIMMAWACWSVPLLVAEPLIQLRAMKRAG